MASNLKVRSDFSEGVFTSLQFVSREDFVGIGVPSHLCIVAEYWFIGRVWESLRFYNLEALGQYIVTLLIMMIIGICSDS